MIASAIMGHIQEIGLCAYIPHAISQPPGQGLPSDVKTTLDVWNPELTDRQVHIHLYDDAARVLLFWDKSSRDLGDVDELTGLEILDNTDKQIIVIQYADPQFLDKLYKMLEPLRGKTHR